MSETTAVMRLQDYVDRDHTSSDSQFPSDAQYTRDLPSTDQHNHVEDDEEEADIESTETTMLDGIDMER